MYIDVASLKHDGKNSQSMQRRRDNGGELPRSWLYINYQLDALTIIYS